MTQKLRHAMTGGLIAATLALGTALPAAAKEPLPFINLQLRPWTVVAQEKGILKEEFDKVGIKEVSLIASGTAELVGAESAALNKGAIAIAQRMVYPATVHRANGLDAVIVWLSEPSDQYRTPILARANNDEINSLTDLEGKKFGSSRISCYFTSPFEALFVDDDKVHAINHVGKHFRVAGPLNTPRTPQGRPVYVQAGSSVDGRHFAALHAEAIFTAHQTLASAQEFYADIKARARGVGRNPDHIKVLPGISPFIAGTEEEARRLELEFNELIQPAYSLDQLKRMIGLDLSGHDLDAPFPRHLVDTGSQEGVASRFQVIIDIVDREQPTLRQLLHRLAGARGHRVFTGTPEQVADTIEDWFRNGAADGFNVMPPWLPGGIDAFVEGVLPILRARGLFREEYEGTTLRDHYRLPRPESSFSHAPELHSA